MTPSEILKQYFGYDEFREGQFDLINALTHGRDVLGVMPTGAGKSICYQVPAMLLPGVTLVISPLISLMRDQVQALAANGIPAAFINSSLSDAQWNRAMANARSGQYKIIYIAPERLLAPSMLELAAQMQISLVAVDEAHCISQWGQDFRPSYLGIPKFINSLPVRPVLAAFTATATPRVRDDILETLRQNDPLTLVTSFDRPNLYFEIKQPKDKYAAVTQYLRENDAGGIIYCSTRKEVESVCEKLIADGHSAARYHAGLTDAERSQSQDDFLYDRVKIIVATNAFGMGIDKSNVRFVIHYNMPQNVESYYQEAGRAGRDGLPSDCILLYARKDINTVLFLINRSENQEEIARNRQLLNQMERYCETEGCLRRYILNYFGETAHDDCGNCGNCNGSFDETDVTTDAQKVLSHITRLNKARRRLMFTHTADILLGKSDAFTDLPTFGIMKGCSRKYIRSITNKLTAQGYLYEGKHMQVTPKASEILFDGTSITVRTSKPKERRKRSTSDNLLAKLKKLRLEIAKENGVPAFIIFSDTTLEDMCHKHPRTQSELMTVSGVGRVKLDRYGERFLQLLRTQVSEPKQEQPELSPELFLHDVAIVSSPLSISRVAENINIILVKNDWPETNGLELAELLIEAGLLGTVNEVELPTKSGMELGITTILHQSRHSEYAKCLLSPRAQRLCVELLLQRYTSTAST